VNDCEILVRMGVELHSFTLPPSLFDMYLMTIVQVEHGGASDLARADLHCRLEDWWAEEMPHVSLETFNEALEKAVERQLPRARCWVADLRREGIGNGSS